ncbi:MAG: type II toxin-antitoxin system HicB family antitoxin [Thermoguttaceae bacterium]|nr:type II toxin-antitoxin system HicB family antitoxin [Thermoguttaceae bacterium]
MSEHFLYPVIMKKRRGGSYFVEVVDFPLSCTQGEDFEDAFFMAKDCICHRIYAYRKQGIPLPKPSDKPDRRLTKSERFIEIAVNYGQWLEETADLEPLEIGMSHA